MAWIPLAISACVFASLALLFYLFLGIKKGKEESLWVAWLNRVAGYQERLGFSRWAKSYEKKLQESGLATRWTGEKILAIKQLASLGALALCLMLQIIPVLGIWFVLGGFFIPDIYIRDKTLRRRREIIRNLPDFLDMLTLIIEAGLDFGGALKTVLAKSRPDAMTEELQWVAHEIRLGVPRGKALENMAQRLHIRDVDLFVGSVIQAERMGTGLSSALRIQADANRERRMQRAEKLALEAPVKMIFPLVFFIFPVVFIVLLGPIIVQWLGK